MLINNIKLTNFRNYRNITIPFYPKLNIIVGPNGIGKTNILESIIVVSNTKSFRTLDDKNLIKQNEEYARIECDANKKYKVVINKTGKSLYIDNNPVRKTSEFIGKLNAVLFKPSDLELFNQSPKERRRLLNIELGKISNEYLNAAFYYNKLLKDKNKLLKEININKDYLELINNQMIPYIQIIIKKRNEFFEYINKHINEHYSCISNTNNKISVVYNKCSNICDVEENIKKASEKDLYYHYSVFGPHHEDYVFTYNNQELESVASQGQIRMVMIAFKLTLTEYIKENIKEDPIVLLDDVLSELDKDNQNRLIESLPNNSQVIITNTDIKNIKFNREYNLIELKEKQYV